MRTYRKKRLGQELITGLNEAISLEGFPSEWPSFRIRALRRTTLGVSQPIFAAIMGASPGAIKAWEQGAKRPSGTARRLMDFLTLDKERIMAMIKKTGIK